MPGWLFDEYVDRMPEIRAQELLQLKTAVQLGAGTIKKGPAQQILSRWQREAWKGRTVKARPQDLARIGIGYEEVKRGA